MLLIHEHHNAHRLSSTRKTTFVAPAFAEKFTEMTRQIGISGTTLRSSTLPAELNYLADLPANS